MEISSLLLVEGKSEESVITELCNPCHINIDFEIKFENGISRLKTALKTHLKSTNTYNKI